MVDLVVDSQFNKDVEDFLKAPKLTANPKQR